MRRVPGWEKRPPWVRSHVAKPLRWCRKQRDRQRLAESLCGRDPDVLAETLALGREEEGATWDR